MGWLFVPTRALSLRFLAFRLQGYFSALSWRTPAPRA